MSALTGPLLSLALAALPSPPAAALAVPPGSLVRWPGDGIERCGRGGSWWEPLGSACWYPVDLLEARGEVEVRRRRQGREERTRFAVGPYPYPTQELAVDDSQVNLSPADLARADREKAAVEALWRRPEGVRRFALPLSSPLPQRPPGGRFGARRIFNGEPRSPHSGADFAAAPGTPVGAAAPGVVALAADHFFSGRSVFLDHGDGLYTMYFHLSRVAVESGQPVAAGQLLGEVGSTGRATGPHLHFAVRWRGARVDPEQLLAPVERVPALP